MGLMGKLTGRRAHHRGNDGFSLLEMAILLLIVGLVVSTLVTSYNAYRRQSIKSNNDFAQSQIFKAMTRFLSINGRLPCPGDPKYAMTSALAGKEVCFPALTPAGTTLGGVSVVAGGRTTADDGDFVADPAIIGTIPYQALGLKPTDVLDAWGNQFGYAVSMYLTIAGTGAAGSRSYNDQYGTINIKEYSNANTASESVAPAKRKDVLVGGVESNAAYDYVYFSFGPDGAGGYNYYGKQRKACDLTTRDGENCNGDSTFLHSGNDATNNVYSTGPGAKHFDDQLMTFLLDQSSDKWSIVSGASVKNIYNKTAANVGIGVQNPAYKLDVRDNVKANNFWVNSLCNSTYGTCFSPTIFGGATANGLGLDCNGGLMTGIQNGAAICSKTINKSLINASTCPSSKYVTGVDALGNLTCGP